MIAIAGLLYWQIHKDIYEDKGRLVVRQDGEVVILSWHSEIMVPMAKRFSEAFSEWGGKTEVFVIDLSSRGGALREGGNVIELINGMKRTHTIITYVGERGSCLSMCVPIYLQGQNRISAVSSRWMFHEPIATDFFSGEEVSIPQQERRRTARRFFDRYFANSDINPEWRDRLQKEWVGKEIWKTGRQLVEENSNIVLELLPE